MTDTEKLAALDAEVLALAEQIADKERQALALLVGRISEIRGQRFQISTVKHYGHRLFAYGKVLTKDGSLHKTRGESSPMHLLKLEPK